MSRSRQDKSPSAEVLLQQARRWFEKHDFKQALKDARMLFRQDPSAVHRKFLEQVAVARAHELLRGNLKDQAEAILGELLGAPVTEPSALGLLPEVLMGLGWLDRYPQYKAQQSDADHSRLVAKGVDSAIVRGSQPPPEFREAVELVRTAIARLENGEPEALAGLRDIPRQSPLADWRLFLRGFSAYQINDLAEALANWSRLDPERVPAKLAWGLTALKKPELRKEKIDFAMQSLLTDLESLSGATPFYVLRQIQAARARNDLHEALRVIRHNRDVLRKAHPDCLPRLTAMFLSHILANEDGTLLRELATASDPLPFDPQWNRAWALLAESDQERHEEAYEDEEEDSYEDATRFWEAYLNDLKSSGLPESERRMASALVMRRLANAYTDRWDEYTGGETYAFDPDEPHDPDDEAAELSMQAESLFRASLAECDLKSSHRELAEFLEFADRMRQAVETRFNLLQKFPDDQETLEWLATHLNQFERYEEAVHYGREALRHKPLDETLKGLLWWNKLHFVRHLGRLNEFDRTTALLEELRAEQKDVIDSLPVCTASASTALEFKAGNIAKAEEELKNGLDSAPPAVVWLAMCLEAMELQLPQPLRERFTTQFEMCLTNKKFDPNAVSGIVALLDQEQSRYVKESFVKHADDMLFAYLKTGLHSKFTENQIVTVCMFFINRDPSDHRPNVYGPRADKERQELFSIYVNQGIKNYPHNASLRVCHATLEFTKQPHQIRYASIKTDLTIAENQIRDLHDPTSEALKSLIESMRDRIEALQSISAFTRMAEAFNPDFF